MPAPTRWKMSLYCSLLGWVVGCAGSPPDDDTAKGGGDGAVADCGGPVDSVAPGLVIDCESGTCAVILVDASPETPDRGDNAWTLRATDDEGSPLPLTALAVEPFMPAHNHGTVPATHAGVEDAEGLWHVGPFDLFMPGRWEVRVALTDAQDAEHTAVFAFCVEG